MSAAAGLDVLLLDSFISVHADSFAFCPFYSKLALSTFAL